MWCSTRDYIEINNMNTICVELGDKRYILRKCLAINSFFVLPSEGFV